ncbi:phage major tail protein, TP901-1 family [Terrihabitans rhizophilus]|jgi:TP901-1 family phage major tail protein|uniref:Phage major tail protein, TP901-1 family n=1 Tax=Terrihabitans rhizophilus TaxID=3092662 RepID=A0ABU4RQV7_9HYPH|nr:phage major tail protein, TP901-1 family [Terrihabitans sp. PJ23]MDX6806563.1 phage major tail protein, TP901-1 family [Terrihabitans sp. PJ23]
MTAQKGKDLLLKVGSGEGGFITIAGLRTRTLMLNAQTVDVTHSESAGRWRELLEGAGVRRASLSGSGVFRDGASDARAREIFFAGTLLQWQVVVPSFGTIEGLFQITSLEYRGDHMGEVTFDLSLESAGELSFTADI